MIPRDALYATSLCAALALGGALHAIGLSTPSRGAFVGRVSNMADGVGIVGARVRAGSTETVTDSAGRYELRLGYGLYDVRAEASSYIGMTHTRRRLASGGEALDFEMIPAQPTPQEAQAIEDRMMPSQSGPEGEDALDRTLLAGVMASSATIRVLMPDGTIVALAMDEYLKGVVPHEMPASWPAEALRAQAVAARSYATTNTSHAAVGADVCTTVHCQVWSWTHYDTTDAAVDSTHGVVATYAGQVIRAFFFAHCDGHTRNSEDVWSAALPYCRSVACPCGYTTRYGHGVGMCQWGARTLAQQGKDDTEILKHYYTGIAVEAPLGGHIVRARVHPLAGDDNTQFTYEATFSSDAQEPPAQATVIIDGHAHALSRVLQAPGADWAYRMVTRLPSGAHNFRFYFDDGRGHISTAPNMGAFPGPSVVQAAPLTPTPTRLPEEMRRLQADSIVHSTVADWGDGTYTNTHCVSTGDGSIVLSPGAVQGSYLSVPLYALAPMVALGVTWYTHQPAGSSVTLQVRTSEDGHSWRPWRLLQPSEDSPPSGELYTADPILGYSTAIQYRLDLRANAGGASPSVESVRLVCMDTRSGPPPMTDQTGQTGAGNSPTVVSRSAWGAEEAPEAWPPDYRRVRAVIVHDTGAALEGVDPEAVVRALYYYDAVVREWGDVGYNYLIAPSGTIYEGRAGGAGAVGRHAGRFDWGSVGIALLGDYGQSGVPAPAQQSLVDLLVRLCLQHDLDPDSVAPFIDLELPAIMGHEEAEPVECPGEALATLLPSLRAQVRARLSLLPREGQHVRAVVPLRVAESPDLLSVDYAVDAVLRATDTTPPYEWKWDTGLEPDGPHALRIVAHSLAGDVVATRTLIVDNVPPTGTVQAPPWWSSTQVPFVLDSRDATSVQFSNNWVFEGESLYHTAQSGRAVSDAAALNRLAWLGLGGSDLPGDWYGPYTCQLPAWSDYQVLFRVKTANRAIATDLAGLDVADVQGRREYARRSLSTDDLARDNAYEDVTLPLFYEGIWPSCAEPGISDGLEFRVAYLGAGDLYLDRVTVYGASRPFTHTVLYDVRSVEGTQTVLARMLDAAGNATEYTLNVHLDWTPPSWLAIGPQGATVSDALSGLDPRSAVWSCSADGGGSWGPWQALAIDALPGVTTPVQLSAPPAQGTHVRYRIADLAGNQSTSPAQAVLTPTETTTPTPSATPSATVTPGTPVAPPRVYLPLSLRGSGN